MAPRRGRGLFLGVLAAFAVGVPGGYLLSGAVGPLATTTADAGSAPCPAARSSAARSSPAAVCDAGSHRLPSGGGSASGPGSSGTPQPSRSGPSISKPAGSPSQQPSPTPSASRTASAGPAGAEVAGVLAVINQARASAGLRPYAISGGLDTSSARHNQRMAAGCGLSHQCPGEPSLGDRETAAGVHWTAAGENIGEGGPVTASVAAITAMAVGLTRDMLNEKPPDDGHRLNLLSPTFTGVGIAIYRDSHGTVWMTQDFAN